MKGEMEKENVLMEKTDDGGSRLVLNGVEVLFPLVPYAVQTTFMYKVVESLSHSNCFAVLESPTGTGKTLSLLCSVLGWQASQKAFLESQQKRHSDDQGAILASIKGPSSSTTQAKPPTIVYASRTHSQLSQVVNELKRTRYRPKTVVLSSRENLCVNVQVRSQASERRGGERRGGMSIRQACKVLAKGKGGCSYKKNVDVFVTAMGSNQGRSGFEREVSLFSSSQNFGADEGAFKEVGNEQDVQECRDKMIMDIEELLTQGRSKHVCPYFLSRNQTVISEAELVFMPYNYLVDSESRAGLDLRWENAVIIVDEAHNLEQQCDEAASFSLKGSDLALARDEVAEIIERIKQEATGTSSASLKPEEALDVVDLLDSLEHTLVNYKLKETEAGRGAVFGGGEALAMLRKGGLKRESQAAILATIERLLEYHARPIGLEAIRKMINRVLRPGGEGQDEVVRNFYNVYVEQPDKMDADRVIHFWCFSPGVVLRELQMLGIHSLILTSGTLSPLSSFANQMRVPFPVQLENDHVIEDSQIWVGVLPKGVTGKRLNSSFQNRNNPEYLADLGNTIANFARQIPEGVLVFFPSYSVMNTCIANWKRTGIYQRIDSTKPIVVEAKFAADMAFCVQQYEDNVSSGKGSMFFAVCRGKASEGIDFSDAKARAVVITGLPFPPKNDMRVILKRRFLDSDRNLDPTERADRSRKKLTGQEWYSQQAFRAVNQAIGRVIRHKNDYGVVLFCDDRFASNHSQEYISKWLRHRLRVCNNFGEVSRQLTQFFRTNQANPKLRQKPGFKARQPRYDPQQDPSSSSTCSSSLSSRAVDDRRASYLDRASKRIQVGTKMEHHSRQSDGKGDLGSLLKRNTLVIEYQDDDPIQSSRHKGQGASKTTGTNSSSSSSSIRAKVNRMETTEKVRARLAREQALEGIKQRFKSMFANNSKKRDASEFMGEVKKTLSKEAFGSFKNILKSVKDTQTGQPASSSALKIRAAVPLFRQILMLFLKGFPSHHAEERLVEFVHFLPTKLRVAYQSTITDALAEREFNNQRMNE